MQTDELTQRVLRIIAETQRKDPAQVTIDSSFEELGIDSMDGVNIVFALENEFDINVPDEEVKNIRSVRDMVDGVIKLMISCAANPRRDSGGVRRRPRPDASSRRYRYRSHLRDWAAIATSSKRGCARAAAASGRSPTSNVSTSGFAPAPKSGAIDAGDHFSPKEADMIDRFAQFAVVAAREAVIQSGIEWTGDLRENRPPS